MAPVVWKSCGPGRRGLVCIGVGGKIAGLEYPTLRAAGLGLAVAEGGGLSGPDLASSDSYVSRARASERRNSLNQSGGMEEVEGRQKEI